MTDYLLANGTKNAPATQAPAHMASWLDARGYRIVRFPNQGPADPGEPDLVARIAALIDWQTCADEDERRAIVSQVLAAVSTRPAAAPDFRRAA